MPDELYYQKGGADEAGTSPVSPANVSPDPAIPAGTGKEQTDDEVITASKLNQILEGWDRKIQSRQDKMASSLDKRVAQAQKEAQTAIDLLKGSGSQLTPEQEANIRQSAVNRALSNTETDSKDTAIPAVPQGQPRDQEVDVMSRYVNTTLEKMMQESGVYIAPAEARILIPNINSLQPHEVINTFKTLIDERKQTNRTSPGSRLPFTQGSAVPGNDALKAQYDQEIRALPKGGNRGETIARLKAKYQAKGLDIT